MKTIIAGSRDITDFELVELAIKNSEFNITEVVCGCAKGIDTLGEEWAFHNNIPIKKFRADWSKFGRSAGPIRNREMAQYSDALIAITNGSKGTANMIKEAEKLKLKVYVYNTNISQLSLI